MARIRGVAGGELGVGAFLARGAGGVVLLALGFGFETGFFLGFVSLL
jgi:hypothetical protein